MGSSHPRRLRWLLAITTLLLLGGGFVWWWRADEPSRAAMARVFGLHRPGPEWQTKQGSLISTAKSTWSDTTGEASVPDRYEALPVIERREEPPGTQPRVRWMETKLVRDERFKYPLLRVVEQWQPGRKGPVRVRQQAMVADHVVVKLRSGARIETLVQRFPLLDPQVRRRLPASGLWLLSFKEADLDTVPRAIAELRKASDLVQAVQADFIAHISATPNDASYGSLWGLHNTGQSGGTADVDIDAPEAWNITKGSRSVLVGVIDTGMNYTHPDLAANAWTNPNEVAGNGLDDDGNGYIDDTRGWDFVSNDNDPADDHGHGTHCSGTIGAVGNNSTGVVGVNWLVSIVGLKFLNASGSGANSDATEAIAYATSIGVTLTSNSWGGGGYDALMEAAIEEANDAGILFVAAAGNETNNNDSNPNYPAGFENDNVISVAAITRTGALASFSNYGATTVDIGAPGQEVLSTSLGTGYATLSGTSMATPHISGACALLKAYRPMLTHAEIKSMILGNTVPLASLNGKCATGGLLNLNAALDAANDLSVTPADVFTATGELGGTPVVPASRTYSVTNRGSSTVSWTSTKSANWFALSPNAGTLAAGQSVTVTVTLDAVVNSFPLGSTTGDFTITNTATTRSHVRGVAVTITPSTIASFNMDSNPGWTLEGQWEYGVPLAAGGTSFGGPDPDAGATGSNVVGINLGGDYAPVVAGPYFATTGPIDLTNLSNVQLQFKSWLNCDYQPFCGIAVQVSTDNVNWTTVLANGDSEIAQYAWEFVEADLSAYFDGHTTGWMRFGYETTAGVYPYSGWNLDDVKLLATPASRLTITLPSYQAQEGDGALTATVTLIPPPAGPVTVNLSASPGGQVSLSSPVLSFGLGQATATVELTAVDDLLLDGSQPVTLTASTAGYQTGQTTVTVHDNETAVLGLILPPSITEGDTGLSGTLTVSPAVSMAVQVELHSSDAGELSVPASVTLPAGAASMTFPITVLDDDAIDGPQSVDLSATVQGWTSGLASVQVLDNEAITLTVLLPASVQEAQGTLSNAGRVRLTGTLMSDLVVSLASGDAARLQVPALVTVPAGYREAAFDLTPVDDPAVNGHALVAVTAQSEGFNDGGSSTTVYDAQSLAIPVNPAPAHQASPVAPDAVLSWSTLAGAGTVPESYQVYLGTSASLGAAELLGSTANTTWTPDRFTRGTTYYWKVVAVLGAETASSPVWQFTVPPLGELHHLTWNSLPGTALVETPFPASLQAVDEYGDLVDHDCQVTITTRSGAASVLITEIGCDNIDAVEITNVSHASVDISGWQIVLYDELSWPSPVSTFTLPGGTIIGAGQVLRLEESATSPGTAPAFQLGGFLYWTSAGRAAVLIRNASGTLVDFASVGGPPSQISNPVTIPAGQWSGAAIAISDQAGVNYCRTAGEDHQTAADWSVITPTMGTVNSALVLPFSNAGPALPVLPAQITMVDGQWSGDARIRRAHPRIQLLATTAGGAQGLSGFVQVQSNGSLAVTPLIAQATEGAGPVANIATVSLPAASATETTIFIVPDDATELADSSFVIPAGQLSANATLVMADDALLDGSQTTTYQIIAAGYEGATGSFTTHDNESATLSLTLPSTVTEADGTTFTGTVSVSSIVGSDVVVALASSLPEKASVPASVVIPAGANSATFAFTLHNDNIVDGTRAVQVTASVTNWTSGVTTVNVLDNEARTLTVSIPYDAVEGQGVLVAQGQVSLAGMASTSVTVNLANTEAGQLTVPASVTIPAGQSSASFDLAILENTIKEVAVDVSITASAATYTSSAPQILTVYDNDAASFTQSTIASPQVEGLPFAWTLTALGLDGFPLRAVQGPLSLTVTSSVPGLGFTPVTAGPFVNGEWTARLRVLAPASNVRFQLTTPSATVQSNAFTVGQGPRLSVNPASISTSVVQGSTVQQNVTLTNSGTGSLSWAAQSSLGNVLDSSPVFAALASGEVALYAAPSFASSSLTETLDDHLALPEVLTALATEGGGLTGLIPFPHAFTDGVSGTFIIDGGADAFDFGNFISTNLTPTWEHVAYSDGVVVNSASFGTGGRYFTRKQTGLFVLAADLGGVQHFAITGDLGADSTGNVSGSVLRVTRGGKTWKIFTKTVQGTDAASVTHVIIVPDVGTPSHEFAQDSGFDTHRAVNLSAIRRLYYLMFSSTSGHIVTTSSLQALAEGFLDIVTPPAWLNVAPASGTLAAGASQVVAVSMNTSALPAGALTGNVTLVSNDAVNHAFTVPVTLEVQDAPPPVAPVLEPEPFFTAGASNTLLWNSVGSGLEYQVERDTAAIFDNGVQSGWISATTHEFNGLGDGTTYHYRVRARNALNQSTSDWSASVRSTQDASPPVLAFSRASGSFTGEAVVPVTVTVSDVSGLASLVFTPAGGAAVNASSGVPDTLWSASLNSLALGLNSFTVTASDNASPPQTTTETWSITRLDETAVPSAGQLSPVLAAAFNVNATAADAVAQTVPGTSTTVLAGDGKTYLTISFRRRIQAAGFTYVVETSDDMIHWNDTGADIIEESVNQVGDGIMEICTCRITPAIGDADQKFVRVRVDLD
jgi:subtilisin family serine protease